MHKAIIAGLSCALAAGTSFGAHTVDVQFTATGLGENVRIVVGGNGQDVFAGELIHQFTNGVGMGVLLEGIQKTFCTDLDQFVTPTTKTYIITDVASIPVPPMGADKAQAIYDIYALGEVKKGLGEFNADTAAAFQLAIWEIVKDFDSGVGRSSMNLDSGNLNALAIGGGALSASIKTAADEFFDSIGSGASGSFLVGLYNSEAQDQIAMIPAPGAAAGLLLAIGFAGRRRRSM